MNPIWATDFAPDGSYVVAGGEGGLLTKLDREGERIVEFDGQAGAIYSLALSSDGRYLASASREGSVALWDPSGSMVRMRTGLPGVLALKFTADGQSIVSGDEAGMVRFWGLDGAEERQFAASQSAVISLDVTTPGTLRRARSDDRLVATGGADQMVRIWDIEGTLTVQIQAHAGAVHSVEFSSDGRWLLSSSDDHTAKTWPSRLWNTADWRAQLDVACDRLRNHPVLNDGSSAVGFEACLTCEIYVWNGKVCSAQVSSGVEGSGSQLWAPATR
jgi:WD40 repeat protein